MSRENVAAFLEGAKDNPELQRKIAESREAAARYAAEALAKLSQETGTPFTAEEFLARGEGELSETEMDAVAGGAKRPQIQWT